MHQFLMAANCFPIFFVYTSLYVFLVTIACSQLEKLTANLLDIRQKKDTSVQDSRVQLPDKEEEEQTYTPQDVFCGMQKQLDDCIRHHQEILRCVKQETLLKA